MTNQSKFNKSQSNSDGCAHQEYFMRWVVHKGMSLKDAQSRKKGLEYNDLSAVVEKHHAQLEFLQDV